jgi:hypothetical protein
VAWPLAWIAVRWVYPMFSALRHLRIAILAAALLLVTDPARADGGWMAFRNDTGTTLVIQEMVSVGTGSRSGKPQKIFANETVRETPPLGGGQRSFTITEPGRPDKPLYTGAFAAPAANENVLYTIKSDGKGGLIIEAIRTPVVSTSKSKVPPKH